MSKPMVTLTLPASEIAKFHRWVETQSAETKDNCKRVVGKTIRFIDRMAKQAVPVKHDFLRTSIHPFINSDGLGGMVYAGRKYAPYQEWGTGNKVNVPTFVKEMFDVDSMEWKGAGKRQVNIKPHPYLFENARIGYNIMITELKAYGFK
jgi:hypothetical protein